MSDEKQRGNYVPGTKELTEEEAQRSHISFAHPQRPPESIKTQRPYKRNGFETIQSFAWLAYYFAFISTFVYLTFFDGYVYTAFNWIIAIPVNSFLSFIWPIYWLILRPLLGA